MKGGYRVKTGTSVHHYIWMLVLLLPALMVVPVRAAVTVTAATGGTAISADTAAAPPGTGAWTTLTGPVIAEGGTGEIGTGTIILNAPAGYEFNTAAGTTVLVTRTQGAGANTRNINDVASGSSLATAISSSQIIFTVTAATSNGVRNSLTWQNIQVRPTQGCPIAASGNITRTGTATINGTVGNVGVLTEVIGASANLYAVLTGQSWGTCTTKVTGTPTNPLGFFDGSFTLGSVRVTDRFGNLSTTYNTATNITYSLSPVTPITVTPTNPVPFAAGVSSTLTATITTPGVYTLTASAPGLTGVASSSFNIAAGTVTVSTPATGGTSLSADAAAAAPGTGAFTTLTGPVIEETNQAGFGIGSYTLTAPAGYEFDTGSNVSIAIGIALGTGTDLTLASTSVTPTATTITFNVTTGSSGATLRNRLTFSNVRVRPTVGCPIAASGNIVFASGTVNTTVTSSNAGTLTEVIGAASNIHTVLSGQSYGTCSTGVTGTPSSPLGQANISLTLGTLRVTDRFGNVQTAYNGSTVINYTLAPAAAGSTFTSPVSFTAGVSTTTLTTTITAAGNYTVNSSAVGLTGVVSSTFVIDPDPNAPVLRAAYYLDEPAWTGALSEVLDSSGNTLHGAAIGGANTAKLNPALSGNPGTCRYATLDGGNDHIQIDHNALLNMTTAMTVSAWINPDSLPASDLRTIVSKDTNFEIHLTPGGNINWWWNNSGGTARTFNSTGTVSISDSSGPYGNGWHHVAVVYSQTGQTIYLNGVVSGTAAFASETLINNGGPMLIGADVGPMRFFDGLIDEVRVYQGAMTAGAVGSLMAETRPCAVTTLLYYAMDEASWTSAGDVVDSSGNNLNGTPWNGVMTAVTTPAISGDPGTCRYGSFDDAGTTLGDYIEVPAFPDLVSDFSLAAWIRTNDNTRPGQRIFADDANNTGYGLSLGDNGAGTLRFYSRNVTAQNLNTVNVIQNNVWYFVVATVNLNTKQRSLYVYNTAGTLLSTVTDTYTGSWGTDAGPATVGGETNGSGETDFRFYGDLDEVRVYDGILGSSDITALISATHPCNFSPTLVGEWRMEAVSWNGFAGEVTDNSGNDLHGTVQGGATTGNSSPAMAGDPGTCRYGVYDGVDDVINIGDNPLLDIANELTVTAWINPDTLPAADLMTIVSKDLNFEFHLKPSGVLNWWWNNDTGGVRQFDSTGTISTLNTSGPYANGWHHVAIVYKRTGQTIYINGVASGTAVFLNEDLQTTSAPLLIGNDTAQTRYFDGLIDEVRIYRGLALTATEVAALMTETHPCSIATVDHYAISYPAGATGSTCAPSAVQISAHDASHNAIAVTAGTQVTLTASAGTWGALVSGAGSWSNGGSAVETYTWSGSESAFQVNLARTTAGTTTINLNDSFSKTESVTEDPSISFVSASLRITDATGINSVAIGTQIAGKRSDEPPAPQAGQLYIQASGCAATISSISNLKVASECNSPTSCTANKVSVLNAATSMVQIDNYANGAGSPTTDILLTFTGDKAPLVFMYPDAGRISLRMSADVTVCTNGPCTQTQTTTYTGTSNQFVVRPFAYSIESSISDTIVTANDASSAKFRKAGENFTLNLRAVAWQAADDANDDGLPDASAVLTNNAATPNFGAQSTATANIAHSLVLPSVPGDPGTLTGGTSIGSFSAGMAAVTMSFDEVGIIELSAQTPDYLGQADADVSGTLKNLGRFYPDRFSISANNPDFRNSCTAGATPFTYQDQNFYYDLEPILTLTALNTAGDVTENYGGSGAERFWKLAASMDRTFSDQSVNAGVNHTLNTLEDSGVTLAGDTDFDGIGTLALDSGSNGDIFMYERLIEEAPFAADVDISFAEANFVDADGVCYDQDDNGSCDSFSISGLGGATLRFGRLAIGNAFGSELLPLEPGFETQYFNGTAFVTNADDSCTLIDDIDMNTVPDIQLSNSLETTMTGVIQICAGGTSVMNLANNPLQAGLGALSFTAPSTGSGCTGSADISIGLSAIGLGHLRGDYDGDGGYLENPVGRISFGIYNGPRDIIYIREPWN